MPLNIKHEDIHARARELAEVMNTSITEAVDRAIQEALERRRSRDERQYRSTIEELREIAERTGDLPVYDRRSAEEILGYDEKGVPE
jgi:antitoxin VapB